MDLVLTLDYELYGSGEGNVLNQIIKPTNQLLKICGRHKVKLTIFFEVVEYWKLKETYASGQTMGYPSDPTKWIENQITQAYTQGHDIQLHIHPQWLQAEYTNGRWHVDRDLWKLPSVPISNSRKCGMNLTDLLAKGKETLEVLIKPFDASYECRVLRAGGLNIFPSEDIISAMRSVGLKADSSVFPGGFVDDDYVFYDYRNIDNSLPYWYTNSNNIFEINYNKNDESKVFELPIFAIKMRRYRKYDFFRLKSKFKTKSSSMRSLSQLRNRTKNTDKLEFFLSKEGVMWDYCLLSFSKMKNFFKQAHKIREKSSFQFHPFVLIGHSKEFYNPGAFEKFIKYSLNYSKSVRYLTLIEAYENIINYSL